MKVSFKPEFLIGSGWSTNALRFVTRAAAERYAADLFSRWTMPSDWRVSECSDAPTLDSETVQEYEAQAMRRAS